MKNDNGVLAISKLCDYTKGWFVGGFQPTALHTTDVEVAIKCYAKGDAEAAHHHKIATEITTIISGKVRMLDQEFVAGDIVKISPGVSTDFLAVEDSVTVVVKHPGAPNDKYLD